MKARGVRFLIYMAVVGVVVAAGGCGLFKVRDPVAPDQGPQIPWQIPVQPEIVLVNLQASCENNSISNFDREFITSGYQFRFDPFQAIGTDSVWDRNRDIAALTSLFQGKGTGTTLTWTPTTIGGSDPDRFYKNLGYRLRIQRSPTDTSHVVIIGTCNLYLRLEGSSWLIRRWEDLQQGDYIQTWGWARLNPTLPH